MGFLAAVLRFIPYVGPLAAAIMPSVLGLAVFPGWVWPVLVVGLFVVLELLTNMVLEPLLYGESAGVSEVALLVSVAFWTWLWGPIGLLLATPLTVCIVVFGKYVPQMEFLVVLISDEPVMETKISYYQRLLAMDQDEAADIVEVQLKAHPPEQIYDEVLVPALNYARRDRQRGSLTEDAEQFIFHATREIVENLDIRQPKTEPSSNDGSEKAMEEESTGALPKVRILGCPARDEADELALLMFRQLLDSKRYEMELITAAALKSEVVSQVGEKNPALICIGALPPGGLAQTRYLCKRLRALFPDLKIVVGRWGPSGKMEGNRDFLLSAGADQVGTTLVETRDQMIQLSQITSQPESQSADSPLFS